MNGFEALSEKPFSSDTFILDVLKICGAAKATLKKLSDGTSNKVSEGEGVLLQKKLFFRPSAPGQTGADLTSLAVDQLTKKYKPRLLVACDGDEVSVLDTKKGTPTHFAWKDLPKNADLFWPLAGHEVYEGHEETKADRDAAYALSKLYDAIMGENPDWDVEARQHDLNLLMTRLLFCMFAEDTGIFDDHLFTRYISDYTDDTGGNVHKYLELLFDHLNTADEARQNVPKWLVGFHYVNGGLFKDKADIPRFSKRARRYLIDAAELDWADINPDIFGTMIQAVVAPKIRGDLGMHYTSVENIMKVIHPLFLMSLEEAFEKAKDSPKKLNALLSRLSKIRIFDPACGSGNFLIVAYQKLRELEMQVFQRLEELSGNRMFGFSDGGYSRISLDNFFGIEIADFAAETAKLSLWIAEYQMNQKFKATFGDAPPDLPLRDGGHIVTDNALTRDWLTVCPPHSSETVETYICGNPPYKGSSNQTAQEKADMELVFGKLNTKYKNLDYVTAWYVRASEYNKFAEMQAAFVATNSICQGEQVPLLWPHLFDQGLEISFARTSFKWQNLAKKNAGVSCIIVGIRNASKSPKILFSDETYKNVNYINAYLIAYENIIVRKARDPISKLEKMLDGSKATDGGFLIVSELEREKLLQSDPNITVFLKRFMGTKEFVDNIFRWCFWIEDHDYLQAKSNEGLARRFEQVRKFRMESTKSATNDLAKVPYKFGEIRNCAGMKIITPAVTSERRRYLPVEILQDDIVVSNSAFQILEPTVATFAIISSKMHILWARTVCGQHERRIRYSSALGYNTFPIPDLSDDQKLALEEHAWQIIEAREAHPGKTIAWLYNPDTMPDDLLAAHRSLDDTLEKVYVGRPFESDTERLELMCP